MTEWRDILGINARNRLFLRYNGRPGRKVADSKILTKKLMRRAEIQVPKLYSVFENSEEANNFSWEKLKGNFVIKPTCGYAGEGILMIKKRLENGGGWLMMDGRKMTTEELKLHIADIFAGRYSLKDKPDQAFVEERIKIHPIFKKYAFKGTPDIRVIVFNRVPVMAMLRLPTEESGGRANLHQGAIGAGIDLATGITTYGVCHNRTVTHVPHSGKKINGLKLPFWEDILLIASRVQEVVPHLGYVGIDFILDKERGPMILELNARPGISIQICNRDGLYRRLVRVYGLPVRDAAHGVKIAKALFAERFADRVMAEKGVRILNVLEKVKIRTANKRWLEVMAKVDTGAYRSSIDFDLAEEIGLLKKKNILFTRRYRSGLGRSRRRLVVELTVKVGGRKIKTAASVVSRGHLTTRMLIGLRDLTGFLVRPEPLEVMRNVDKILEKERELAK